MFGLRPSQSAREKRVAELSLTVDASARSWVDVPEDSHFPIQNLPLGLACMADHNEAMVIGIGEHVLDLCALCAEGLIPERDFPMLHCMLELERGDASRLREIAYDLLREDNPRLRDDAELRAHVLRPMSEVEMMLPMEVCAFVDFYSGIHHASNVGRMFRPDMPPLLPNYRHLPVAYQGRASSVIPSGVDVRRPHGIQKVGDEVIYGPTRELDYELELGVFLGQGTELGHRLTPEEAQEHILGCVLVNDWSARDVQRFEYQPLGPFLAKSFATSVSPWLVLPDALTPLLVEGQAQDPAPLPHLRHEGKTHLDLRLEVAIKTAKATRAQTIAVTNAQELYWSVGQQLAHLTSNGTPLEPGDLIASGTISGPESGSFGSLLEATWRGTQPIQIEETGEDRTFLEDGDEVIMTAFGERDGIRIGFGELRARVLPA
ncbi:fumarylacetoacetase [bacterium]|nr:MAG: fumarylacetoacetase [bacterium]